MERRRVLAERLYDEWGMDKISYVYGQGLEIRPMEGLKIEGNIRDSDGKMSMGIAYKFIYIPAVILFSIERFLHKTLKRVRNIVKHIFKSIGNSGTKMLLITILLILFPLKILEAVEVARRGSELSWW